LLNEATLFRGRQRAVSESRATKPQALPEHKGVYRFVPRPGSVARKPHWDDLASAARALDIVAFGVAPAAPFRSAEAVLRRWLEQGFGGAMRFLSAEPRHDPRRLLPSAKSVLVIAVPHARSASGPARVARYALGRDYHHVVRKLLLDFGEHIAIATGQELVGRICADSAPLLERAAALQAGVGFMGKSTLNIVPGLGSYFVLGELLVDLELPESPAQDTVASGCGRCTRCLDACPTGAFVAPYVLDARRCISYLTIELDGSIPRELRSKMGDHVFGCDLCQTVCPFNQSKKPPAAHPELKPEERLRHVELLDLLELSSTGYRRLARRTALRRPSREQLQRNAAVALGNATFTSDGARTEATHALVRVLAGSPSPMVREHVAWALGRVGSAEAMQALVARGRTEVDSAVLHEIALALGSGRDPRPPNTPAPPCATLACAPPKTPCEPPTP
jgi:epoxyqueuosine reductase